MCFTRNRKLFYTLNGKENRDTLNILHISSYFARSVQLCALKFAANL